MVLSHEEAVSISNHTKELIGALGGETLEIRNTIYLSWWSVVVTCGFHCLNPIKVKAQHCYLLLVWLVFCF